MFTSSVSTDVYHAEIAFTCDTCRRQRFIRTGGAKPVVNRRRINKMVVSVSSGNRTMGESEEPKEGELIIYQTSAGAVRVEVLYQTETFWLNQKQIAELFGVGFAHNK